jgi:ABC-type nitrate/sulfonate/bicarbonate transport system substrate-binding protein
MTLTRRQFGNIALGTVAASVLIRPRSAHAAAEPLIFQANWVNDPEFIGYMLAIEKGFYGNEGLNVTYIPGGPSVIPEGSLLSGKSDIALTTLITTAKAIVERNAPLKIIGTQYQRTPVGIISLAGSGINSPKDLMGKTIAVPTVGDAEFKALMKLHNVAADSVRVVPYTFNPASLINGSVDAVWDFVTQVPHMVEQAGKKPNSFLIYDNGLPFFMDLVVVHEETLKTKRAQLIKFLRASRKGWMENFADVNKYPEQFKDTWFKGNGSSLEAEIYFNKIQQSLIEHPKGLYTIADEDIARNLKALEEVGVKAPQRMFDASVVAEL